MGVEFVPEKVSRLGRTLADFDFCKRIGVASCDGLVSQAAKYALVSGLMSGGAQVWDFGECFVSQFKFLMSFCSLDMGAYICDKISNTVKLYGEYGIELPEYIENEIRTKYLGGQILPCFKENYKSVYDMSSMQYAYENEMIKAAGGKLKGVCANIKCSNFAVRESVVSTIERLGGEVCSDTVFRISQSGCSVSAYEKNGCYASFQTLLAICLNDKIKNCKNAELLLNDTKKLDGVLATMKIIGIMCRRNMTLGELADEAMANKAFIMPCQPDNYSVLKPCSNNYSLLDNTSLDNRGDKE